MDGQKGGFTTDGHGSTPIDPFPIRVNPCLSVVRSSSLSPLPLVKKPENGKIHQENLFQHVLTDVQLMSKGKLHLKNSILQMLKPNIHQEKPVQQMKRTNLHQENSFQQMLKVKKHQQKGFQRKSLRSLKGRTAGVV